MATDQTQVDFLLDQMGDAGRIAARKMFGEYALYCDDKVVALVCDNQLFVKPTDKGRAFIGHVVEAPPYPGARPYFLIEDQCDDRAWLSELVRITAREVPSPKPRKPTSRSGTPRRRSSKGEG